MPSCDRERGCSQRLAVDRSEVARPARLVGPQGDGGPVLSGRVAGHSVSTEQDAGEQRGVCRTGFDDADVDVAWRVFGGHRARAPTARR